MSHAPSGQLLTGNENMSTLATVVGLAAAICTTAANLPQLKKAWTTGQTDDISLKMLLLFACGLGLWVVYGVLQKDIIIILANGVSLSLLAGLMYLKLRQTPS
jgi:MtN3 and saliva related transmembrane protein